MLHAYQVKEKQGVERSLWEVPIPTLSSAPRLLGDVCWCCLWASTAVMIPQPQNQLGQDYPRYVTLKGCTVPHAPTGIIPSLLWYLENLSKSLYFMPKLTHWGQHAVWWQSLGRILMSEHPQTFPTSALNTVPHEDGYSEAQSITLMERSPPEFPAGQLHPKPSPTVVSTWRNRGVQKVWPAKSGESTEFSALNLVSLGRKGKKKGEKKKTEKIF